MDHLKTKSYFIPVFQCLALVIGLLIVCVASARASSSSLTTDYDDYDLGTINGQDGWTGSDDVVDTQYHSSPQSATANFSQKTTDAPVAITTISFWTKIVPNGNAAYAIYDTINSPGAAAVLLSYGCQPWANNRLDRREGGTTWVLVSDTFTCNYWHKISVDIDGTIKKYRLSLDSGDWTDWLDFNGGAASMIDQFFLTSGVNAYIDDLVELVPASINIVVPTSGSSQNTSFEISGDYDKAGGSWDKLFITFEQWETESTCPADGTPEWTEEYNKGWFIYQSMPYFSEILATDTGAFALDIDDLRVGTYNCVRCYFVNQTTYTLSELLCPSYTLSVSADITPPLPPSQVPILPWATYYNQHSDKYPTSTALFTTITDAMTPVVQKLGEIILWVKNFFDPAAAAIKGTSLGQSIPAARGYLENINQLFGSLPLSEIIIFYLVVMVLVISYKTMLQIFKIVKP